MGTPVVNLIPCIFFQHGVSKLEFSSLFRLHLFLQFNSRNSIVDKDFRPISGCFGCWGFTTVPVTKTIRLSEWVTPGDTAIPGMTSLKDGDLQHSSALAQSPKEI